MPSPSSALTRDGPVRIAREDPVNEVGVFCFYESEGIDGGVVDDDEGADELREALERGQVEGRQSDARFAVDKGVVREEDVADGAVARLRRQMQRRHAVRVEHVDAGLRTTTTKNNKKRSPNKMHRISPRGSGGAVNRTWLCSRSETLCRCPFFAATWRADRPSESCLLTTRCTSVGLMLANSASITCTFPRAAQ